MISGDASEWDFWPCVRVHMCMVWNVSGVGMSVCVCARAYTWCECGWSCSGLMFDSRLEGTGLLCSMWFPWGKYPHYDLAHH